MYFMNKMDVWYIKIKMRRRIKTRFLIPSCHCALMSLCRCPFFLDESLMTFSLLNRLERPEIECGFQERFSTSFKGFQDYFYILSKVCWVGHIIHKRYSVYVCCYVASAVVCRNVVGSPGSELFSRYRRNLHQQDYVDHRDIKKTIVERTQELQNDHVDVSKLAVLASLYSSASCILCYVVIHELKICANVVLPGTGHVASTRNQTGCSSLLVFLFSLFYVGNEPLQFLIHLWHIPCATSNNLLINFRCSVLHYMFYITLIAVDDWWLRRCLRQWREANWIDHEMRFKCSRMHLSKTFQNFPTLICSSLRFALRCSDLLSSVYLIIIILDFFVFLHFSLSSWVAKLLNNCHVCNSW